MDQANQTAALPRLRCRSRVNSSCGPRPVTGLTGGPLRTFADQGHHYGAGGPSPTSKWHEFPEHEKWPSKANEKMAAFNWISSVSADKSGGNNGKNGTLRCAKGTRPPPPPPRQGYRRLDWTANRSLSDTPAPPFFSLPPKSGRKKKKTLIKWY